MAVFTSAEALNIALRIEKSGQAFYEAAAQKMADTEVKGLMEDLAAWEVQHYKTFQNLSDQVGEPPSLSGPQWEEYQLYMESALQNALFQGPDKAVAVAEGLQDEEEALRMALGFEKDALLFYYDLREMMPEEQREIVGQIIQEEKTHAQKLASMLRSGETEL